MHALLQDVMTPVTGMPDLSLRLGVATVMGGLVGLNRELRDKPAGLRTHALVALGSSLLTLVAVQVTGVNGGIDPGAVTRTLQGIVTGIGFIGGGVILRDPQHELILGLTTAATIFVTAALGVACGVGLWRVVVVAVLIAFVVLVPGAWIERWIHRHGGHHGHGGPPGGGMPDGGAR
jgi:putative Mg2+ transporter-C (MgtC) family protein